jgi:hypothetical protein
MVAEEPLYNTNQGASMKLFKIRDWFKRKKPVELTDQQLADMHVYEQHAWPKPVQSLQMGDKVWVMVKGCTPQQGTVTNLRKIHSGNPHWVVKYGESDNKTVAVKIGDPAFMEKDDLILWHIGDAWRTIGRLYGNLQKAVGDVETVAAYTEQRVSDCKREIKFLETQLEGKHYA